MTAIWPVYVHVDFSLFVVVSGEREGGGGRGECTVQTLLQGFITLFIAQAGS